MNIKFDSSGLVPVITQDFFTKEVLILSYMNEEALNKTLEEKQLYYYSRSRKELWKKGETSGHTQELTSLKFDCDSDALLAIVKQKGPACHTGQTSCFHNTLIGENVDSNMLNKLYSLIENRKKDPIEGSYTNYLLDKGREKILKKVGEESSEIIIASMSENKPELIYEIADFVYHAMVLMVNDNITLSEVLSELESRYK